MKSTFFTILLLFFLSCSKENNDVSNAMNFDSIDYPYKKNQVINFKSDSNEVVENNFPQNDSTLEVSLNDSSSVYIGIETKNQVHNKPIYDYHTLQIQKMEIEKLKMINEANYWNNRTDLTSQLLEEYSLLKNKIEATKPKNNINNDINPNHNPELIDVQTYQKSNGTVVEEHIRTRGNSTIKDNLRF